MDNVRPAWFAAGTKLASEWMLLSDVKPTYDESTISGCKRVLKSFYLSEGKFPQTFYVWKEPNCQVRWRCDLNILGASVTLDEYSVETVGEEVLEREVIKALMEKAQREDALVMHIETTTRRLPGVVPPFWEVRAKGVCYRLQEVYFNVGD